MQIKSLLGTVLFALAANTWAAGNITGVKITDVSVNNNGMGMVVFASNLADAAGCSVSFYKNALTVDVNTAAGRSMMSIAMMAFAAGKTVTARGTGGCVLDPSTIEDAAFIRASK